MNEHTRVTFPIAMAHRSDGYGLHIVRCLVCGQRHWLPFGSWERGYRVDDQGAEWLQFVCTTYNRPYWAAERWIQYCHAPLPWEITEGTR